ncbi:hypothetical protein DVH24_029757 [Malus domestica]|uniref:SWIM-type domain-containing protein n=1 Tax=Malus domestica TaxID=3750 RepID=A0A498HUA8_MALDO|nr:hypothetical protein DVH24_029757 [Malus domestica]
MPILDLIELIKGRLMVMMFDRMRSHWIVSRSSDDVFEARGGGDRNSFVVMLDQYQCSCVELKHKGFPCTHVLQVIMHDQHDTENFFPIVPVSDLNKPTFDILNAVVKPPFTMRQGGRPCIHRYKSKNETRDCWSFLYYGSLLSDKFHRRNPPRKQYTMLSTPMNSNYP